MKKVLLFVVIAILWIFLACDDEDFNIRQPTPTPMPKSSLSIDIGEWDAQDVTITTR